MNFIFCIDVSGSMYNTLPKLREDLKNRFPSILSPKDTVSLIYFSGANEVGTILSNFVIDSVDKITDLQKVVDKWLVPQGLTAYTPPLEHAFTAAIVSDVNVLVFMTDGYNNDSSKSSVFDALSALDVIDYKYFVEYGNYADTKFLQEMANKCGGTHLTAKDFLQLQEVFSIASERHVPMQEVLVNNEKADKIYVFDDSGRLFVHPAIPELPLVIKVPTNTLYICSDNECEGTAEKLVCVLAALRRGEPIAVDTYLKKINNNDLWQRWENAYGKQKQNELYDYIVSIIKNIDCVVPSDGIETSKETTSVFELLEYLYENNLFMSIPSYDKISLGKDVDALTSAQKEHLASLTSKKDIDKYLEEITPLEFTPYTFSREFCASSLTFNTSRANVSALVCTEGKVKLPNNKFGLDNFQTHTYRNYTFIRDGILNIPTINVDKSIGDYIVQHNLYHLVKGESTRHFSLDLTKLPIVRRDVVKEVSAEKLAKDLLELTKVKALLKVLKTEATLHIALTSNEELNEWLKSLGITRNGYSPVGAAKASQDTYMSVELKSSLKSLSSLPAVTAVRAKIADGKKLTLSEELIANAIRILDNCPDTLIPDLLTTTNKKKRMLESEVAKDVFSLIISKGWFSDKKDYDDNKVILPETECTFSLIEKPVNI